MGEPPRRTYESPADLKNEVEVVEAIYRDLGCDGYRKTPKFSAIDFALLRGDCIAYYAEVKCRRNERGRYPDYMISRAKYDALDQSRKQCSVTSLLVVRWTDYIGVLTIPPHTMKYGFGGRRDRNDPKDMEPVVYIPTYHFQTFIQGKQQ
jgi:hypothetical protein